LHCGLGIADCRLRIGDWRVMKKRLTDYAACAG